MSITLVALVFLMLTPMAAKAGASLSAGVEFSTADSRAIAGATLANGETWEGSIRDDRGGTCHMKYQFNPIDAQTRDAGAFWVDCADSTINNYGALQSLTRPDGRTLTFQMVSSRQASCVYDVTAQLEPDGTLGGSYRGCSSNSGTFVLNRVANVI
jgi:hypothetical protein